MSDSGIVKIHGKEYKTVALRVKEWREDVALDWGVTTEVIHHDDDSVIVRAQITHLGQVMSSGLGEERRSEGNINRTSALENAETSAVGRALAFLGYGGSEIASADEVAGAIKQGNDMDLLAHMDCVREHVVSIVAIKDGIPPAGGIIDDPTLSVAVEAWRELGEDVQRVLWRATTKGGIFTTHEREFMKSTEWRETQ